MRKKIGINLTSAHTIFAIIGIFFGLFFIKLTPPLWGLDETSHFARVYQLAHGDILPDISQNNYGGNIPDNLIKLDDYVKSDLLDNKYKGIATRQDVDSRLTYQNFTAQPFSSSSRNYIWTAVYSPLDYIGPVIGVIIADLFNASIGHTIFMARVFSLLTYILITWISLRVLKNSKLRWLVFLVALLPVSLYQASVVTADNLTIALSILFISLFMSIAMSEPGKADRKRLVGLIVAGTLLPLIKLNYIFLSFAIVLLPAKVFARRRSNLLKYGTAMLITIISMAWASIIKVNTNAPVSQRPDGLKVDPTAQLSFVGHHPIHFFEACARTTVSGFDYLLQSGIGLIGWNYVSIPLIFTFLLCLGIVIGALYSKNELANLRKTLTLLGGFVILGILGVFGALYIAFNPVGRAVVDGIQGRYFIPLAIPGVLAVATFIPIEVRIKDKAVPYIFSSISAICLVVSVIYYYLVTY